MTATSLTIVERAAPFDLFPSVPQNFVLREGESLPPEIVIDNPNISLYCLDDEHQRALFAELPPGIDLSQVPFFYEIQYLRAQRLIAVSYDSLHQLADDLPDPRLILVYSIGRCGSTLISRALNEVEGVVSYSEPDLYTQIAVMRFADPSRDDHYTRLLTSCTRILCRGEDTFALKFRANVSHIADLLYRAFPDAKSLFLYRHAETWAQSVMSAFGPAAPNLMPNPYFVQFMGSHAPLMIPFMEQHGRATTDAENMGLFWLSILAKMRTFHDQGMPYLALRYEQIKSQPRVVLAALFDYCGLDAAEVDHAYAAFAKDLQEGTFVSQANRQFNAAPVLGEADYAQLRAVLSEHPVIQQPDYVLPGTLEV